MLWIPEATSSPSPEVLTRPGGFAWTYLDLVDAAGNGLVAIWSFGLPFLPGIAADARAGHPRRAVDYPSFNLCVYREGRPDFYLLKPVDARLDGRTWTAKGVQASVHTDEAGSRVTIDLELPVTGTGATLEGWIQVEGPLRRPTGKITAPHPHVWCPLVPHGAGRAHLTCGAWRADLEAPGYVDRNHAPLPLHDLGVKRWTWGRAVGPDHTWIFYLLWAPDGGAPTAVLLRCDRDGHAVRVPVHHSEITRRFNLWGLPIWSTITLHTDAGRVRVTRQRGLDASPFYQRDLCVFDPPEAASVLGFSECCDPDRVDRWPFTPLVEMCVDRGPASSRWLPLFSGPAHGGARRLLTQETR